MHRTTIMIPEDLKTRIEDFSRKKGLSMGEVVREAVKELLMRSDESKGDSFFCDKVVYKEDAPKDISLKHDEYLYGDKP